MASCSIPLDELDDEFLRCPTCRERFSSPKLLTCQHVFCVQCLEQWISKKSGKLHCPICRTEHKLSSEGVDGLPDSLLTNNLLELVCAHQEIQENCVSTDEPFDVHEQSETSLLSPFCPDHPDNDLDILCETCSRPICQQCAKTTDHNEHDLLNLADACRERRKHLQNVRDKLDANVWRVQQKVSTLGVMVEQLDKDNDIAESQIKGHCDLSIDMIAKYEAKLLDELEDKFQRQLNGLREEEKQAELPGWMAWSEFVDGTISCSNDLDFLRREKTIRQNFDRLEMKMNHDIPTSELSYSLKFHSNDDFLNKFDASNLGTICLEKIHEVVVPVTHGESTRTTVCTPNFRVFLTIDKFWCSYNWTTRSLEYPHALAISPNGTMFVVDSKEHINVFSAKGEFIRHFRPSFTSNKPWPVNTFDITVVNEDELAITDLTSKRVFICSLEGRIKRRCGGSPLRSPVGIAYGKDGKIYVVDNKACRVVVFALSGKCLYYIGHHDSGPGRLKNPQYVAVNSWNHVIVTDTNDTSKNRICVFDSRGEFIYEFGQSSMDDGHILAPRGITCDQQNNIIVSSYRRVLILGPDGTFLGRVDGAEGETIQDPRGIDTVVVNGKLRVVVADNNAGQVKVFEQTNTH
ncbi:tripartite motif-containing protein 2-like [Saccoglossus kowalevskii]|uniref:E3 ubiquitin-protein ligase TRIM32-like n=1 Tax=Saccoglossus kowalevskii TaxID=10224 RepID=A0ABM0MQV2_SACKO|nr:PREDICTED: E3 ubiquitin-protein ligase TRIM32-like [Saccoglossus kowalevskii]